MADDIACPICGCSTGAMEILDKDDAHGSVQFKIIKCDNCHVRYDERAGKTSILEDLNHQKQAIEEYYLSNFSSDEIAQKIATGRQILSPFLRFCLHRGTYLEIGVGLGFMTRAAADYFSSAIGLDIDVKVAHGISEVPCNAEFVGHDEWLKRPSTDIDVLCAWHVIEHLPRPYLVLNPLLLQIRIGGLFIGQVPLFKKEYVFDAHYIFYTESGLARLLEPRGFEPVYFERDEVNGFLSFCFRKTSIIDTDPEIIYTVMEKYFLPKQIARAKRSGAEIELGGARFKVIGTKLVLQEPPDNPWLKAFIEEHGSERGLWATIAFLKVRYFSSSAKISQRARTGDLYDEDYYTRRGGGSPYVRYPIQESGFDSSQEFAKLAQEIAARFSPSSVLDLGCATGVLVKALQSQGVSASGVDISEWATSNAVTSGVHHASATNLPFGDNMFDVAISQDFMEHIHPDDLASVLSEQVRVVREGGILVHFIPFYNHAVPTQEDAHLCNANRDWWLAEFAAHPLRIEQLAPNGDQWAAGPLLDRYFILRNLKT